MKNRIEIEQAENGFSMRVWKEEDKEEQEGEFGYHEPKVLVAESLDQVVKIIKENFKDGK